MKRTNTLKRSGFKRKVFNRIRKQQADKAKKAIKAVIGEVIKKVKLPSVKSARNKADALLTPLVKLIHPLCLLCNNSTEVAHHHVHKSKSTRLRYDLRNLIPLCNRCHVVLHHDESYWGSKVSQMKCAQDPNWFNYIEQGKREQVRADVHYYLFHYNSLKTMKDELEKMG